MQRPRTSAQCSAKSWISHSDNLRSANEAVFVAVKSWLDKGVKNRPKQGKTLPIVWFAGKIHVMEKKKIVEGYILSAIDMEERFAQGVYLDYTVSKNWPVDVDRDTFEEIQSLLKILIADTTRHRNILSGLKEKLAQL